MLYQIFKDIIAAGPTVLIPLIIFVLALAFRVKPSAAFRSAATVGVGFAGLRLIISFMTSNLSPAVNSMVKNFNLNLEIIDVGWGTMGAIAWASPLVAFMVLAIILLNVILLLLNLTNTLSLDVWNYHHCIFVGVLVYFATNNLILSIAAATCAALLMYKLADWSAPLLSSYFRIDGVSTPGMGSTSQLPFAPLVWLVNRIPGIGKYDFNLASIQKRFGVAGEPMVLGLILGCAIGVMAEFDIYKIIALGVNMATAMYFLPVMARMFADGLKPISAQASKLTNERFKNRKLLIGLDPAIMLGDGAVITTALLMVPVAILVAAILPGNRLLPFADLPSMPYKVAIIVALCNGNILRSMIVTTVSLIPRFYWGTWTAVAITSVAKSVGVSTGASEGTMISSLTGLSQAPTYAIYRIFIGNLWIGLPIFVAVIAITWFYLERKYLPRYQEALKKAKIVSAA